MTIQKSVILKAGKEKAIRQRHHWIFSGAVHSFPSFENGEILSVYSFDHQFLGYAYFNRRSGIVGRMLSFDETPALEALEKNLKKALDLRKHFFNPEFTNSYRLVNGEGDGIPGLILDCYGDVVVLQSSTLGIDKLKSWIVHWIREHLNPITIYEKSQLPSRREEGIENQHGFLFGKEQDAFSFMENGLLFTSSLEKSQKTGFFLDHREMRQMVRDLSKGKKILNAFSYTGGFTISALAGGAARVDSVDISEEAIQKVKEHTALNGFSVVENRCFTEDVFNFLREKELSYDLIILDPPAFAKKQKDIIPACRGYKDINRLAIQKMPSQSLLLTCSCSYYVDEGLFQKVIFQSALEAKREVRIIGKHRLGIDHPVNVYHPESHYLKSLLLYID